MTPTTPPDVTAKQWGDERAYLSDDRDKKNQNEMRIMLGGNGDWYVTIAPQGEGGIGRSVRICTSGGAASACPGLPTAIADAYRAMKYAFPADAQPETPQVTEQHRETAEEVYEFIRNGSWSSQPHCETQIAAILARRYSAPAAPTSRVSFAFDERSRETIEEARARGVEFEEIKVRDRTLCIPKGPFSAPAASDAGIGEVEVALDHELAAHQHTSWLLGEAEAEIKRLREACEKAERCLRFDAKKLQASTHGRTLLTLADELRAALSAPAVSTAAPQPAREVWGKCEHEWEASRRDYDLGEGREEVVCRKCGCPGERCQPTGEVYWPAT